MSTATKTSAPHRNVERELSTLVIDFVNCRVSKNQVLESLDEIKQAQLSDRDDETVALINQLEQSFDAIARLRASSLRNIQLDPISVTDPVGDQDIVVIALEKITVNELFGDSEIERHQDIIATLNVNGQENSVAFKRSRRVGGFPSVTVAEKRILYSGQPFGLVDLDFGVIESEERQRELLQKIEELLKTASTFAGYVPAYGTAIGAGLSLGAAVAALIRSALRDDKELRYLGCIGGPDLELKYGNYALRRTALGATPDVEVKFTVSKLDRDETAIEDKNVTILLESMALDESGASELLGAGERIMLDAMITGTPEAVGDDQPEPRISGANFEQEYIDSERSIGFQNVFKINEKLLYDGPWGKNIGYSITFSAFPFRMFGDEEILGVLNQAGALISSVVDEQKAENVRRGFEIAQAAASVVIKYAPDRLFSVSKTGLLFEGAAIPALAELILDVNTATPNAWQPKTVKLDLGDYGELVMKLVIRVKDA